MFWLRMKQTLYLWELAGGQCYRQVKPLTMALNP